MHSRNKSRSESSHVMSNIIDGDEHGRCVRRCDAGGKGRGVTRDAGASRCSRPEQQVEPPGSGKAFCYEADLHNADLKAYGPLGVSIRVER